MNQSIDIIGPYPPPYGGISVHIFRIERILKANNIPYRIYNHGFVSGSNVFATNKSILWYLSYLLKEKASLIHFHQFFSFHYLYFFVLSRFFKSKLIVTIHEEKILSQNRVVRSILLFFIRRSKLHLLISVSKKLSDYLHDHGISNLWLPAYVPPIHAHADKLQLPGNKQFFIYSIWKLEKSIAAKIYNVELAFSLLSKIKHEYHMLFLIGSKNESDQEYLNQLINEYGVGDSIIVLFEHQLVDYLPGSKFLLRTNNEDGYGVSIQEALDLRVPAIASDVCVRPKGTILFKKNDLQDLVTKVSNINSLWNEKIIESPEYHIQLIEIYKRNLQQ